MSDDLDTLLSQGDGPTQSAQQPESAPQPEPQSAPTGDKPTAPPAVASEPDHVPRQAVIDERRKRQDLERRVAELQEQVQRFNQPQPPEAKQPEPDWWQDPQTAAQHLQSQVQNQMQARLYQQAVYTSEKILRQQHQDYDEVANLFAEAAKQDQRLLQQVLEHPFPAEFAYKAGRQIKLMQEIGEDPDSYRSKLEAEILAKHGLAPGQAPAPQTQQRQPQAPVPRSLARDTSIAQPRNSRGQFDSPASLDDILG